MGVNPYKNVGKKKRQRAENDSRGGKEALGWFRQVETEPAWHSCCCFLGGRGVVSGNVRENISAGIRLSSPQMIG